MKPSSPLPRSTSPLKESLELAEIDVRRAPARVLVWYLVFGAIWIVGSDLAVSALLGSRADAELAQTGKGLAFIALSGGLIYLMAARAHRRVAGTLRRAEHAESLFLEAQRTEALSASVAEIVHDFRNNLAVVSGYADLASASLEPTEEAAAYVGHIQHAASNATLLSAELLVLARGRRTDGVLEGVIHADAAVALGRIGDVLRHLCGRTIEVDIRTTGRACVLPLSAHAFEQIVMNLAINARDAMPTGGRLTIDARCENSSSREPVAVVTISDTGTGMDADTIERIWDPYFTTKPAGKGTGLGLPAVRVIVEQAGGSITVTSTPGRGASFRIELPCVEPVTEPVAERIALHEVAQLVPTAQLGSRAAHG